LKYYAGIGSRETPSDILSIMTEKARILFIKHALTLRSGGAKGADSAFERGCDSVQGTKEIFRAADATQDALDLAKEFHPAWNKCTEYAQKLHGRNMMIVLGADLQTPVDFILCWTPGGQFMGGTAQALRAALFYKIPVYNLFNSDDLSNFNNQYLWK